jgi:DNA-binding response OmpR family regulator
VSIFHLRFEAKPEDDSGVGVRAAVASKGGETVLLVDDDPDLLSLLKRAYDRAGYRTVTAANGHQAGKVFDAELPDLVVTDIVMPDVEGIATILALRLKPRAPRIIAMSGAGRVGGNDFLKWAQHLGADRIIRKPFRMREILEMSRDLLQTNSFGDAQCKSC